MLTSEETVDAEKSFRFPFEDQEWTSKLGLGALISLVPILNFAWSGYMVGIIRNVIADVRDPLPTWDDLDKKFREGLILFGAGVVYALPILFLLCLPLSLTALSGLLSGNNDLQDLSQRIAEAGGVLFFGLLCVLVLYGIVLSVLYPAILVLFAREATLASCFKLREALDMISRNPASFFTAWGLSLVAGLGVGLIVGFANMVVGWVPCIGWIISLLLSLGSGVYLTSVYAHLFGQFGRTALERNQLAPIIPAEEGGLSKP